MIGHKNIATTLSYDRNVLSPQEQKQILDVFSWKIVYKLKAPAKPIHVPSHQIINADVSWKTPEIDQFTFSFITADLQKSVFSSLRNDGFNSPLIDHLANWEVEQDSEIPKKIPLPWSSYLVIERIPYMFEKTQKGFLFVIKYGHVGFSSIFQADYLFFNQIAKGVLKYPGKYKFSQLDICCDCYDELLGFFQESLLSERFFFNKKVPYIFGRTKTDTPFEFSLPKRPRAKKDEKKPSSFFSKKKLFSIDSFYVGNMRENSGSIIVYNKKKQKQNQKQFEHTQETQFDDTSETESNTRLEVRFPFKFGENVLLTNEDVAQALNSYTMGVFGAQFRAALFLKCLYSQMRFTAKKTQQEHLAIWWLVLVLRPISLFATTDFGPSKGDNLEYHFNPEYSSLSIDDESRVKNRIPIDLTQHKIVTWNQIIAGADLNVKRGRGRPKKPKPPDSSAINQTKRGPGRPKKVDFKDSDSNN